MKIEDGTGTGSIAKVRSDNKLNTYATTVTEYSELSSSGVAFNANTGGVALTTTDSAVFYLKNNEELDLHIEGFFVGIGAVSGTISDPALIRAYVNPTGGTIVSGASAISVVNRNFGSSRTFDFDCYKGVDGNTLTGQDAEPVLYQYQNANSRTFGTVNLILPRGSSFGVTIDLNTTGGGNIYCGVTGYLK